MSGKPVIIAVTPSGPPNSKRECVSASLSRARAASETTALPLLVLVLPFPLPLACFVAAIVDGVGRGEMAVSGEEATVRGTEGRRKQGSKVVRRLGPGRRAKLVRVRDALCPAGKQRPIGREPS